VLEKAKIQTPLEICIACGRGVCKEHLIREETPLWKEIILLNLNMILSILKELSASPSMKL
jgi:hypothetical protein